MPDVPRAELRSLLRRYRRIVHERYHDSMRVLHWQTPARVWAIDFAEPSECCEPSLPPIDGRYPYLVAVRDLGGYQLAWLPVMAATAEETVRVLASLFARYGPPLVLKLDNGPPFVAAETGAFLDAAGVLPLFSPPHWPSYNGAIEAGIGSLKTRTERQAFKASRLGCWTWDDVEAARQEANTTARPHGERGPTPAEAWTNRTSVTALERTRFQLTVDRHRFMVRTQERIGWDTELDHWQGSALDRKALQHALVEHGYLLFTRRRLPLRIKPRKVTTIS